MTLDKGSSQGLAADMAVIAPAGIVGRVILPTPRAAKVQLHHRPQRRRGRARRADAGPGRGGRHRRRPDALRVRAGTADVKTGDRVVTSGMDGIYPKGFVIGQIESIERTAGEFSAVLIRPSVNLSSLEAVLVVTSATEVPKADRIAAEKAEPATARPE